MSGLLTLISNLLLGFRNTIINRKQSENNLLTKHKQHIQRSTGYFKRLLSECPLYLLYTYNASHFYLLILIPTLEGYSNIPTYFIG